jgi:hypothetical protein
MTEERLLTNLGYTFVQTSTVNDSLIQDVEYITLT